MGNKLLLADDSITIQKVVGIIFANEDYDLTMVDNGIAALEKAREVIPDIILIDALMPGKNGYEVCEELRRDPAFRHIPLLLMTGAFEPFDEERARQCGADESITKPFESQHLIDKVKILIAQGKERSKTLPEPEQTAPVLQSAAASVAAIREVPPVAPAVLSLTDTAAGEQAGDYFTVEEEGGEDIFATDLAVAEEVVEVTPDEDLWGAFDVEEVPEVEAFAFEETAETAPIETAGVAVTEEEFFFAEEEPGTPEATAEPFAAPQEFIPPGEPAGEDFFSFAEEPGQAETAADSALRRETAEEEIFSFAEEPGPTETAADPFAASQEFIPPGEPDAEDFFSLAEEIPGAVSDAVSETNVFGVESGNMVPGLDTTEEFLAAAAVPQAVVEEKEDAWPHAAAAAPEVERQLAPEEEYVPAFNVQPAAAIAAVPSPMTGEVTLSDEQLTALVSRISRDVLERIAWEVVPDLAETIIREEIRKIKEGQ